MGVHCECAGLTKSTSFPMAVRIGIGGELGPLKEDCSNKISVQDREKGDEGGARGSSRKIWKEALRGALKQVGGTMGCWREVQSFGGRKKGSGMLQQEKKTTEAGQHTHVLGLLVHKAPEEKTCICSRTKAE